eukprot:1937388-Rhodomonas_salina.2
MTCLVGQAEGHVRVWGLDSLKVQCYLQRHSSEITALAFLAAFRLLATADATGRVCLWTAAPWPLPFQLLCEFKYRVPTLPRPVGLSFSSSDLQADSELLADAPTAMACLPLACTLLVAGSKGWVVAYDMSAAVDACVVWQRTAQHLGAAASGAAGAEAGARIAAGAAGIAGAAGRVGSAGDAEGRSRGDSSRSGGKF